MSVILILLAVSVVMNFIQMFIIKLKKSYQKDFQESYDRITKDNRKLQEALYKINEIEKRRIEGNEKIDNAPDSDIFNIINNTVRNPKG